MSDRITALKNGTTLKTNALIMLFVTNTKEKITLIDAMINRMISLVLIGGPLFFLVQLTLRRKSCLFQFHLKASY